MRSKLLPLAVISSALILLSGCASYRADSLNNLSSEALLQTPASHTHHDVYVSAKAFDKTDCKRYLDRDVLRKGYQPIQLYIQNKSDKNYLFSLDRLSLPYSDPQQVARTVHTSTVGRVLGYGIPGLFLFGWPLIVPAIVDGIKSSEANTALDNDYIAKTINGMQVIAPHSHFNKLIFVDVGNYQSSFTLTLIESESKKEETFNILAS